MAEDDHTNPANLPHAHNTNPPDDIPTQPAAPSNEQQHPTRNPAPPVSFPRPAPTFHEDEEKSRRLFSASVQAPHSIVNGSAIDVKREITVRGKRCERCPKITFTSSSQSISVGGFAAGGSAGRTQTLFASYNTTNTRETVSPSPVPHNAAAYLVLGIFSPIDRQPREKVVVIRPNDAKNLFLKVRFATMQLRGAGYFFSLKSVRAFRLYRCLTSSGEHQQLAMDDAARADLRQFKAAYKKNPWPPAVVGEKWTRWTFECLDGGSLDVMDERAYSLEVVLGWSPSRIAIAVLSPVVLSLVVGLWLNARDWGDLATIQTAWGVASYIATAGGSDEDLVVAAVLAIISGLADN
ncbi:uncharacterized protein B0H64DRAFT_436319 [Chaetomium fimeti]|uniref:Uncharacterized protein n=1 Tax=Chaetomium fimeti TaxID=1854472 RepID=A0AAE0LNA3_9PEZI|nr:hypothetical protein B0H64DRAFT_436319 [Chaetomium fimeti]